MVTLTAVFKTPTDAAAFDEHYNTTHSPLMQKVPGLLKMEVTKKTKMLTPPNAMLTEAPYLLCTMYFADKDSFKAAMASEENKAAGSDLMSFAGDIVSMFIGDTEEVVL